MPSINRFFDPAAFARATVDAVARAVALTLAKRGRVVLAVPGGSTARLVLPALMATPLAWDRVRVTLTDERWVPLDHPDSNEALLRSLIGKGTTQPHIEGLYETGMTPQAALPNVIARWPLPHVILLGMGEDGHIASLFPADEANQSQAPLAITPRKDHWRMTLTPATLRQANSVILAFTGKEKSAIFERSLMEGAEAELPVRHVLDVAGQVFIGP